MPYKIDICGIYKIVNTVTGQAYVGQSQYMRKRLKEHFRLLRADKHPNKYLQHAFNKYGDGNFYGSIEVECSDLQELDRLEEAFICGDAWFPEPTIYNIAAFAKAPMRGKKHSREVRERISLGRRAATFDYSSKEYRGKLVAAQMARFQADPKFVEKVRFILDNPDLSYAERARRLGADTSSVRRLAIKYTGKEGFL